ncbi:MAG: hypothetical protein F083_3004, partial [bacterium F083]
GMAWVAIYFNVCRRASKSLAPPPARNSFHIRRLLMFEMPCGLTPVRIPISDGVKCRLTSRQTHCSLNVSPSLLSCSRRMTGAVRLPIIANSSFQSSPDGLLADEASRWKSCTTGLLAKSSLS